MTTTGAIAVLDHLVVAAATLEQGVAWCETTFGFTPTAGGQHPLMGTHNRVFKVAGENFPLAYFEIIAIDPAAPPPQRRRWFGLDEPALQRRLAQQGPQLVHAVARTGQLDLLRAALVDAGLQPGPPLAASRATPQGLLAWKILVRDDGALPCGGALPTLIQWGDVHPAQALPDSGVVLQALELNGLPDAAAQVLRLPRVSTSAGPGPALRARFATPRGEVLLQS